MSTNIEIELNEAQYAALVTAADGGSAPAFLANLPIAHARLDAVNKDAERDLAHERAAWFRRNGIRGIGMDTMAMEFSHTMTRAYAAPKDVRFLGT